MQRKLAPRIRNIPHLVQLETERHFKKKGVDLPQRWRALIVLACFPSKASDPAAACIRDFTRLLDCAPDLALEVLCFARKRFVFHESNNTKASRVRRFLLDHRFLFELPNTNGKKELAGSLFSFFELDLPFRVIPGVDPKRVEFKAIPITSPYDKEIATLLFGAKCPVSDVEIVKDVRQSLSQRADTKSKPSRRRAKV